MSLRRVLVTTALVAVLASSLFSGWLTTSSSILKPPTAQAADYNATCSNQSNLLDVTANFSLTSSSVSDLLAKTVKAAVSVRYTGLLPEAVTSVRADLYRAASSNGDFSNVGPITLTSAGGVWQGELTNTLPIGTYRFFVQATAAIGSAQEKRCSSQSIDFVNSATSTVGYTKESIASWFDRDNPVQDLEITVYETADTPPKVLVPKSKLGNRPPEDLTFKLVAHSGQGAFFIGNIDWMTFQGYVGSTKVDYLYFQISDNLNADFFYSTNYDELKQGHRPPKSPASDANGTEIASAYAAEGSKLGNSIGNLFTYIMNVPVNADGSVGGENCGNGATAKEILHTGPKGKGLNPEPDINKTSDRGVDGFRARHLTQNCTNDAGNSANGGLGNGWLAYWGVKDVFNSNPGSACGLNVITGIKDGVGPMIVKIFACVVQSIIDGIFQPLEDITQGAGEQTGALECNLAGETNAQIPVSCHKEGRDGPPNSGFYKAWKYSLGLINVLVILALLVIAFANILHLNLNTYAAKKALPGLVIGVVGANASILLIRFVLDVAKALQLFAFDIAGVNTTGEFVGAFMEKIGMTAFENHIINGALIGLGPVTLIIILIFAIYMFFLVFVFAWGMIKRLVYIYGLTVLAPLAFVSYGIPGQQQWFTKWWDMMLRQIFMLPIVFLGAALLIKFINITVVPPNKSGPLDVSKLIEMLLVFLTATAILKLPGLITKGAVDITGAAKKAFGMAKTTPQNVLGFAAGQMKNPAGKYWTGKETASRAKIDMLKGRGDRAGALKEALRLKNSRKNWRKRAESGGKSLDPWRKYSTIAGNPEIFYAGYQDRMKQAATDRKVEFNSTKAEDVPFVPLNWAAQKVGLYAGGTGIRGIASGRKSEVNAGIDDVNDYIARGGDIQKLIDDVMLKEGSDRPVWAAIKAGLSTGKISDKDILSLAGRTNKSSLQSAVLGLVNENGLAGHDSGWRSHGVMREVYEAVNKEVISRTRNTDLSLSDKNELTLKYLKEAISSNGSFTFREADIAGHVIPPGGSKATPVPSGAAAAGGGPGPVPSGAAAPSGKAPMKVFVTNPVQIQNPQNEAMFNKLAEHAQTLMETVGSEKLIAHAAASGGDVSKLLSGEVGEAINAQIGHLMNEGGGKLIHELVSAAANGGDVSALRALVARGEIIDRTGQDMANEAAGFSDEQLKRFAETVGKSTAEGVQSLGGVLAPHFKSMGITDPKIIAAYGQKVIDGIQSSINKGPKSLRAEMVNQFGKLAKTVAQEQGLAHIDNMSLASSIAQAESRQPTTPPAAQASTTNVTNVSNVEQTTRVEPDSSTQADISSTPSEPEPPTTGP